VKKIVERPKPSQHDQQILTFIQNHTAEKGWPPTVREIGKAVGISSTASVQSRLRHLEMQGWIKRGENAARAITVIP
jgi:repressor LexA